MPKLFQPQSGYVAFECPGCGGLHEVPVEGSRKWKWNGSMEKPTLHPSLKVTNGQGWCCHLWVKDGRAIFCADSTHKAAGQTLEIPEVGA